MLLVAAFMVTQCGALVIPAHAPLTLARAPLPRTGPVACSEADMEAQLAERNKRIATQVEAMITEFPKKLAPGVAPPAALATLETALNEKNYGAMFIGIYELTIDGETSFQLNGDQLLEPLDDIDWTNTEDETVKAKMQYLYQMGIQMLKSSSPEMQDAIKKLVMEKLVNRVGLEGKAFDDWLL